MTQRMSREERRRQIADASLKLIGEHGLRAFTVAHIAKEVGLKDGSLFRHFKNKEGIVDAAIDRLEEILAETVPRGIAEPTVRLRLFFVSRVRAVVRHPGVRVLVLSNDLIHAGGAGVEARVDRLRMEAQEFMRSCLLEARDKGLMRREVDVEHLLVLLHGAVMSLVFLAGRGAGEEDVARRAEGVLDTLLGLLRS